MLQSMKSWIALFFLLFSGVYCADVSAATADDCPRGFARIPSGAACAAIHLAGENGDYPGLIAPAVPGRACPAGFERPAGVRFCIATKLTLNATGELPILESNHSRFCPEGFHRPVGSTICIASNLTLKARGDELILSGSTQDCPLGFYRPVGSTACIAANFTQPAGPGFVLPKPAGLSCPKGFHRPPGVAVCIAEAIVYGLSAPLDLAPPTGECPKNWYRPAGIRFCIPKYVRAAGVTLSGGLAPNPCPAGTYESWFDMPIYDEKTGLFVVDYVPTRFCVRDDLPPAG